MRFKSAIIKDYKRFTQLAVQGIPETARLIMLAGPNGSGKSSFFDALSSWHKLFTRGNQWNDDYHLKVYSRKTPQWNKQQLTITFHHPVPNDSQEQKKLIYTRSAFRNDPEFQTDRFQRVPDPLDESRVNRMIDNDVAISRNYQRLVGQLFEIFDAEPVMTNDFTESLINPIRNPVSRLFPELVLNSLANPMEDGTFRFTKRVSEGFHYKNLSGGEKAVFDLILDLVIARRAYDNTLFCIDEPEAHMNARVQAELLSVFYDLIPENCQLMLATHSIGMMRRARDIEAEKPGSVVFLDFGGREFDEPVVIEPTVPDRAFWNTAYKVALDDLAALVAPERVVICEGEPLRSQSVSGHSLDAQCYDSIFNAEFPETRFVSMGSDRQIIGDQRGLAEALRLVISGLEVIRLIDRDARSSEEVAELAEEGIRVLSRRNLESYLFSNEVLTVLAQRVGKPEKVNELLTEKCRILKTRTEDAPDDLKPASGQIYNACKSILNLANPGNNTNAFMRVTLAPLIKPDMHVYKELKRDIFGAQTDS